jgi:hypothetical protein
LVNIVLLFQDKSFTRMRKNLRIIGLFIYVQLTTLYLFGFMIIDWALLLLLSAARFM